VSDSGRRPPAYQPPGGPFGCLSSGTVDDQAGERIHAKAIAAPPSHGAVASTESDRLPGGLLVGEEQIRITRSLIPLRFFTVLRWAWQRRVSSEQTQTPV
jgi:hypothetical protein